ncbi:MULTISPECIES: hypothetical protein [unclassified Sphingopyxis]|uniref:hypothetical protein n=1 Tax=Alphaproteobacteria TaxID=28211 RepID=UPI00286382C7|nr:MULTISPECIES: hypothetical protein [unclassified Sphingopyxis]MDR7058458.1 hypothetical protein [Sphingopyxis sp. BE235]MDR7179356.1 hypothetical protein [Sphingopyxis sp. BE249]
MNAGIRAHVRQIREQIDRINRAAHANPRLRGAAASGIARSIIAKNGNSRSRSIESRLDFDIHWRIRTRNPALVREPRPVDRQSSNAAAFSRFAAKALNFAVSSPFPPSGQGRFRCREQLLKQNCKKVVDANRRGA